MQGHGFGRTEDEQECRLSIPKRVAADLTSWRCVAHVGPFVAPRVAGRRERCDAISEIADPPGFVSERKCADGGMETIGADQKIEPPLSAARKSNVQAAFVLLNTGHSVVEEGFSSRAGTLEDESGELAAGDAHEAIPERATDGRCTDL